MQQEPSPQTARSADSFRPLSLVFHDPPLHIPVDAQEVPAGSGFAYIEDPMDMGGDTMYLLLYVPSGRRLLPPTWLVKTENHAQDLLIRMSAQISSESTEQNSDPQREQDAQMLARRVYEELAQQQNRTNALSSSESEMPCFEVTFVIEYGAEIEAPTLQEAEEEAEETYGRIDFADYGGNGHREIWKALNEPARLLLYQSRKNGKRKRQNPSPSTPSAAGSVSQNAGRAVPSNSAPILDSLVAKALAWKKENLTYSSTFEKRDPGGDEQTDAEGLIAAHLFDRYEDYSLFQHTTWIIAFVAESFFPRETLSPSLEDTLMLVENLQEYLSAWQNGLASPNEGPDEEEAAQAGRDALLLTLRYLWPDWVHINEPNSEE